MKPSTLKGRKVNQRVLRHGKRWHGKTMLIYFSILPADSAHAAVYMGSFASVKLHKNAVVRNRMRRRCKEALRVTAKPYKKIPPVQLLISPKSSSLDSDYSLILQDAEAFIQFLISHDSSPA